MGQPLELILARNLMSTISTPSVLVDDDGVLVFYNDAAASLLGQRFEEAGKMPWEQWGVRFGPFDRDGAPIPFDELPLTVTLREGCPAHERFTINTASGERQSVEVSAMPLVSTQGGFRGAIAFFWRDGS